jgi:hypothetical protein
LMGASPSASDLNLRYVPNRLLRNQRDQDRDVSGHGINLAWKRKRGECPSSRQQQ